jgi:hypothetical protein
MWIESGIVELASAQIIEEAGVDKKMSGDFALPYGVPHWILRGDRLSPVFRFGVY